MTPVKGLFEPQRAHDPQVDKHGLRAQGNTWPMMSSLWKAALRMALREVGPDFPLLLPPSLYLTISPFPSLAHICQTLFLFLWPTSFLPLLLQWSQSLVSRGMMLLSHWELNTLKSFTPHTLASCRACINNSLLKKLFWWRSRDALCYGANNLGSSLIWWPLRRRVVVDLLLGPMT